MLIPLVVDRYMLQYVLTPSITRSGRNTDSTVEMDKTGNQECLRFPPFHQQVLAQQWWSPGEDTGRVKLVISEGIAPGQNPSSGFRRVKNLLTFSFQHAPLGEYQPDSH